MTKMYSCLKWVFISFTALYAILGIVLLYEVIKSSVYSAQLAAFGAPGMDWTWVYALVMLGTSCLGIYAARSEKILFFKIFAGCMGVGMVIMLILGIVIAVKRNQAKNSIHVDLKNEQQQAMLHVLQEAVSCCGVTDASDWGNNIPQSCACNEQKRNSLSSASCIDKPWGTTGPNKIWGQGCKDFIFSFQNLFFNITMGMYFGLAVAALLGLLITLLMIRQINRRHSSRGQ